MSLRLCASYALAVGGVLFGFGANVSGAEPLLGSADFMPSRSQPVGWRGDGSGRTQGWWPGANPPKRWGFPKGHDLQPGDQLPNLAWQIVCPNETMASPIVVGNKVITLADPHTILAYALGDGRLLWSNAADQFDAMPDITDAEAEELRDLWCVVDPLFGKYNLAPRTKTKSRTKTVEDINAASKERFERCLGMSYEEAIDLLANHGINPPDGNGLYGPKGVPRQWQQRFRAVGLWQRGYSTTAHTEATPVSDGQHVWVSFSTNTVTCYAVEDGRVHWSRFFGGPTPWTNEPFQVSEKHQERWPVSKFYPSPLLIGDVLVIQHGHFLRGLHADTGETLWEHPYCKPTYGTGTPVSIRLGDVDLVVTARGLVYRASDGHRYAKRICPEVKGTALGGSSPITNGRDVVYIYDSSTGGHAKVTKKIHAYRLQLDNGGLTSELLWATPGNATEGSAACDGKYVYVNGIGRHGHLIEAETGVEVPMSPRRIEEGRGPGSMHLAGGQVVDWDGRQSAGLFEWNASGDLVGIGETHLHCVKLYGFQERHGTPIHSTFPDDYDEVRLSGYRSGVLGWIDPTFPVPGVAYGHHLWFHGSDVLVRTKTHLYRFSKE